MGKKKGKKVVKIKMKTPQAPPEEPEELTRAPHSFVIHRGSIGKHMMQLMLDFRKVMEPFTASSLQVKKKNSVKDFVSISGLLNVSHMTVFTITEMSPYMRLVRLPKGPTLTFKIHDYSLARDVVSSLRRQYSHSKCFLNSPLIIMNGFTGEGQQLKLMSTMFQSMFPTLNVSKLKLNAVKRCVLLNYNSETKCIDFRHYVIRVIPTGLNRGVKKIVLGKVPNLAKYNDVSDFVFRDELLSDMSEAEEEGSHVVLPQQVSSKGNYANNTSAIKLTEIGPRLTLQLVKVEGGMMDGEVMFHEYIQKTKEELEEIRKQRRIQRRLKETRRREQEMNVQRKEEEKNLHKEKCLEGIKRKEILKQDIANGESNNERLEGPESKPAEDEEEDDDAEWYRKEVGQEPDPELFSMRGKGVKRKGGPFNRKGHPFKKGRFGGKGKDSDNHDKYQDRGGGVSRGRGRGGRVRLGTGRDRIQAARGGFKSRPGFNNRDSFGDGNRNRGFSTRGRFNNSRNRGNNDRRQMHRGARPSNRN